jgi:hypothetical protein
MTDTLISGATTDSTADRGDDALAAAGEPAWLPVMAPAARWTSALPWPDRHLDDR